MKKLKVSFLRTVVALLLTVFFCLLLYPQGRAFATFFDPHGNYNVSTEGCAACHNTHGATGAVLFTSADEKALCYKCHDGSSSIYNVKAEFGETVVGSSVYESYHGKPNGAKECTLCHNPHLTNSVVPQLLEVGPAKVSSGNDVCAFCHGLGSTAPGGDMVTLFAGTPHDVEMTNPASGTQIKCARCHQPHGTPYTDLLRTSITDQIGGAHTVTGNNNSVCFACHSGATGNFFGQSIYNQTIHGSVYSSAYMLKDTSRSQFSQGTLTRTAATASGELNLARNMGLYFDGSVDRVNLASNYTSIQNTFTYELWVKPYYPISIYPEATSGFNGSYGQRFAINAQSGFAGPGAGVGVSVGTNGITVSEQANGYFPPLLVYPTTINNWVHVAVVYNNRTPLLYINGVFIKTGLSSPKNPFPSNVFGYQSYIGLLDDVRIWNYARSQAEIQADMNKELAGNETGLLGYWKFNEGTGTTTADSTAGNTGTIVEALWNNDTTRYSTSGNRISPDFDLAASTVYGSTIYWNASIPEFTSMSVDTNVYLGGVWQGWQTATNGSTISGLSQGTKLIGAKIKYRTNLATTNTTLTPSLQDLSVKLQYAPEAANRVYPGTGYQPTQCINCHEPHGKTEGVSFYRREDGNQLCIKCHDDELIIPPANYVYRGIATYNETPHSSMNPIPNPDLYTNPAMAPGYCVICHNPHGKNDGTGVPIPKQLQLPMAQLCFGGGNGCHSDPANSTLGVSIQNRFTAGTNSTTHHSISPTEQAADNTQLKCTNCHNPHINNATSKLVDPNVPSVVYNLTNAISDYVDASGNLYMMLKAKHDGIPPQVVSGPTVSNMSETGCQIEWTTDEFSSCVVEYGPTDSYGTTVAAGVFNPTATLHRVTLSGLVLGTNYHYRVKATDRVGNYVYTTDRVLDNVPPNITVPTSLSDTTANSANVNWTTDEQSTSVVAYNTVEDYSVNGYAYFPGNNNLVTQHAVDLNGLTPGVDYRLQVSSMDARGNTVSDNPITVRLTAPPSPPETKDEPDVLNYNLNATVTLECYDVIDPNTPLQYYFEVSTVSNFSSLVAASGWLPSPSYTLTVSNYYAVPYYWRVRVRNIYMIQSSWSDTTTADYTFIHDGGAEPKIDSCPFVYTWNGTVFEYVSDMSGPVLNLPKSVRRSMLSEKPNIPYYLPTKQLVPDKNNEYLVKFRSNAPGEIDILDQVRLALVDHAPGYEIVSASAERPKKPLSAPKFYTVSEKALVPIKAIDKEGKDVTSYLTRLDNKPAPAEEQDFTKSSMYTLDFGHLDHPEYAKLVLDGWTHFKNNIKVKPIDIPRVEVINEKGQWEKVREIGHITGDKKSMAIDMAGAFKTKDHRIRIWVGRATARVVLDRVRLDQSAPIPIKVSYVDPRYADLHGRGPAKQVGETFDHPVLAKDDVRENPTNYLFYGRFTKYGDVIPLLKKADDMFVIMQHGDEVLLKFPNPDQPAGTVRTPVVMGDFFYKQTGLDHRDASVRVPVEPLPFHGMSGYPYSPSETYPQDEAHNDYREKWLTREYKLVEGVVTDAQEVVQPTLLENFGKWLAGLYDKLTISLHQLLTGEEKTLADNSSLTPLTLGKGARVEKYEAEQALLPGQGYGQRFFKPEHYSLNTNYVMLQTDVGNYVYQYTVNSAGAEIYDSSTVPTPASPGEDGSASKSKVATDDGNRWTTDKFAPNTNDGSYNYQTYKFVINEPKNELSSLRLEWKGYGEPTVGYNTTLTLWNFAQSRWDTIYDNTISTEISLNGQKYKDYGPYCYKCHGGVEPSGVMLGPITKNIAATYPTDYHGGSAGYDTAGTSIKAPFARGAESLSCNDCHDTHGSQNAYHLRENVNGSVGLSLPDMRVANQFDTSKNVAVTNYCKSCHTGTLDDFHWEKCLSCHWDPGGHDCSPPVANDFSRACTYCHTHGGTMPAHGRLDGDCHCGTSVPTKAF